MSVLRHLAGCQGDAFDTRNLTEHKTRALVYGRASAQIRQAEGILPISTVRCSDQIEQHIVGRNRQ